MGSWSIGGNLLGNAQGVLGTKDNNPLVIETNGSQCLTVDTSGNVGIGSSPFTKLHVQGASDQQATIAVNRSDNNKFTRLGVGATGVTLEFDSTSYFSISNNAGIGIGATLSGTALMLVTGAGNVGIATTTPNARLEVVQAGVSDGIRVSGGENPLMAATDGVIRAKLQVLTGSSGLVGTETNHDFSIYTANTERLKISANGYISIGGNVNIAGVTSLDGNVGIALSEHDIQNGEPASPLVVHGDIRCITDTASVTISNGNVSVSGDVLLTGADCAEQFDAYEGVVPDPGTVLIIDPSGALRESTVAYDNKVAGVVSGGGDYRHGIVLDQRPESEDRVPVALMGKVYCKVDAQYGAVEIGDLLTTSATPGHAMKAAEPAKAFGAIIGKALGRLAEGVALIPILVALE